MNFFNPKYLFKSPLSIFSLSLLANCIGGFVFTNSAQAQSFTLDFGNAATGFDGSGNVTLGDALDARLIDGAGQPIPIGGTNFSTTAGNVGNIFDPIGLSISSGNTVGLFNSFCIPSGAGGSNVGATESCDTGNGDNDLATGNGFNPQNNVTFDTTPQDNLLIVEEGAGDGEPDDLGSGGNLTLTFAQGSVLSNVLLDSITFVDDVEAEITVNFVGGTNQVFDINLANGTVSGTGAMLASAGTPTSGNNAVGTISGFTQTNVASIDIDFTTSGGIGEFVFTDFQEVPFEFSPGLGLLLSGVGLFGLKLAKRKKSASELEL